MQAPFVPPSPPLDSPCAEAEPDRLRRAPRRLPFTDRGVRALVREAAELPAPERGQAWTPRIEAWDTSLEGFGVRASRTGTLTWVVRYRRGTKQRVMTLGNAPQVSLAEARRRARQALGSVDAGDDPAALKHQEREAASFGALAALYLEKHAPKKRSGDQDRRMLERELLPKWRTMPAADIRRADVIAFIEDIAAGKGKRRVAGRPAPVLANRVLALMRKIYNFGIQRGLVESNPCTLVQRPATEKARERVLTVAEIRGLWRGLDAESPEMGSGGATVEHLRVAVKLMLLTAQRRGEVLRMRWSDISHEDGLWTWIIPGEHAKNGHAHHVPLAQSAVVLLDALREHAGAGPYVFPGRSGGHLTNVERAIDRAREREGLAHFTPHDLRRTAASHMTGLGVTRLVVKKILNHVDRDVTAIYDRHGYDAEKRAALEAWARRVEAIASDEGRAANVMPFQQ